MKTALEIIDETVEYYSTHKRAIAVVEHDVRCKYFYRGMACAVGRCMPKETAKRIEREKGGTAVGGIPHLDTNLLPEYRGHGILFWESLQNLHDTAEYWDGKKLTIDGKTKVENIKKQFA